MENSAIYQSKLTTPEEAVSTVASGSIISMGMAMSEPPALLRALADRVEASQLDVDTFLVTVSPMDQHGYFTFGTGNDYSSAVARSAKRLIVEVNENMPRVFGRSLLHVSEVEAIVENHVPLLELPVAGTTPEDRQIALTVADMVPDGACLQMGVGSLPNIVCAQLGGHKDLGIHTECFVPGMVDLIESVQFVVTESGAADLKGKSSTERLLALVELAHPQFREDLLAKAKELHLI